MAAEAVVLRSRYRQLRTASPPDVVTLKARRDADRLRSIVRALAGPHACLPEAFALRAGLRALGMDVAVIIGYARVELSSPTGFHAWAEFNGEALAEPSEVSSVYEVVKTYGHGRSTGRG